MTKKSDQIHNRNDLLTAFADGPRRLEAAIAGVTETNLDISLSSESWTIRQIVHHITDGDDIWKTFIKQAVGNPGGEFNLEWYWQIPQNHWSTEWAYEDRPIEPSLALFRANRNHLSQLMKYIPDAWDKSLRIRWPDGTEQEVDIEWVVVMQTHHIDGHIEDIRRICELHNI